MKTSNSEPRIETILLHTGESEHHYFGAVVPPLFTTSTYHTTEEGPILYPRLSNSPGHEILHAKLAALEGTDAALVTSSGMAAISSAVLAVLTEHPGPGHILVQQGIYGTAYDFFVKDVQALGHKVDFVDLTDASDLETHLRTDTRLIYLETISNPLLQIPDLKKIASLAKAKSIPTLIDNTFATPLLFQPHSMGIDLVVHSATKYLNGHSDVLAGVVCGSKSWIQKIQKKVKNFGGSLDGFSCYLLNRGLKTLPLRMKALVENAQKMAEFFQTVPQIKHVYYPGLNTHPQFARAKELFCGAGAMITFDMNLSEEQTLQVLRRLHYAQYAPSLGGVESLVTLPWRTSHSFLKPDERLRQGITPNLVRFSIGLENVEDLQQDWLQALG